MAVKKWVPIVAGIVVFVVIVGLGLIAGLVYMVTRQVNVQTVASQAAGEEEFNRQRGAFAGQQAFIELPEPDSDSDPVVHREMASHPTGQVHVLHVWIWVPHDRKLVRLNLPMWALRLTGNGPIHLQTGEREFHDMGLKVTAEEIDRRGPGLVLEHTGRRGERLLVWSE
jgi:hypothetical protein